MAVAKPNVVGELIVDDRGRTSLAKVRLKHQYDRYQVEELPGGTLICTPLVTVPAGTVTTAELLTTAELRERAGQGAAG